MTKPEEYVNLAQEFLANGKYGPLKVLLESALLYLGDDPSPCGFLDGTKHPRPIASHSGRLWSLTVLSDEVRINVDYQGGFSGPTYASAVFSMEVHLTERITALKKHLNTIHGSLNTMEDARKKAEANVEPK